MKYCYDIILIGPMAAGKSTVAKTLSRMTGLPVCSLDEQRIKYLLDFGLDFSEGRRIEAKHGYRALYEYCRQARQYMPEKILGDFRGHIFDFGAEDSIAESGEDMEQMVKRLASYPNVFLIFAQESISDNMFAILNKPEMNLDRIELNRHFLENPSNRKLAKHIIIRGNKTYEEVAEKILALCKQPGLRN